MKYLLMLMFMVLAVPALADKYPAKCSLLDQLVQGFEITGGFRWDFDESCPEFQRCKKLCDTDDETSDTPFVGANLRIPYGEYAGLFVTGDRDLTDAPRGNVRLGFYFAPWRTQ